MIEVWRVNLDTVAVPPPTSAEEARAARFATEELSNRYLAAHGALREILGRFTSQRLQFAVGERGSHTFRWRLKYGSILLTHADAR